LRHVDGVSEYLPETRHCAESSELVKFVERHKNVYLKLAAGSLGNGTARVDRLPDGRYRWRATRGKGQIISKVLPGRTALAANLRRHNKGRTYLMQQGISLLQSN